MCNDVDSQHALVYIITICDTISKLRHSLWRSALESNLQVRLQCKAHCAYSTNYQSFLNKVGKQHPSVNDAASFSLQAALSSLQRQVTADVTCFVITAAIRSHCTFDLQAVSHFSIQTQGFESLD